MAILILDSSIGFPVLSIAAISIQCLLVGFIASMGNRKKMFNRKFLEENFGEEHWKAFGQRIQPFGYPDMGNGRYSEKLSYADWYTFNNGQRTHYNFVEQVGSVLALILVAALAFPMLAGYLGWGYFVGRLVYTFGYIKFGPKGRNIGALIMDLVLLVLFVVAIYSGVKVWNGSQ